MTFAVKCTLVLYFFYYLLFLPCQSAPVGRAKERTFLFLKNLRNVQEGSLRLPENEIRAAAAAGNVVESLECAACKVASSVLEAILELDTPEEDVAKLARAICIVEKIEDENVCSLVVEEFKQEVLTVAYTISLGRAKQLCAILLGPSCQAEYNPKNQTWDIAVPGDKPPVKPIPKPKPGSPTSRILHLSDIHWDQNYTEGLSKDCGEPICCRPPNKPETGVLAAGKYGEKTCDLANSTLINLMQHLNSIQDQFDWIYVTGDLPAHNVWNQSRSDQLFILRTITDLIKKYLPSKKCFFTFGNHESAPVNSFPPPGITTPDQSLDWLLNAAVDAWGKWLSQDSINNMLRGGFYNEKIRDGLRVISIQTNYANSDNFWLYINDTDPAGQLSWLVEQLQEAEKVGDKVHLIGHIPPSGFTHSFGWSYHKIVNRFESTIAGQFFGHTHKDEFEVFFDENDTSRATSIAYIGPSVIPSKAFPGFRIYTLDGDYEGTSNVVLDYTSYYFNLTNANLKNDPAWTFEYAAKGNYSMPSLLPQDWAELVNRFESDDTLFQQYYRYRYKLAPPSPCDAKCKAGILCGMLTSRKGDHSKCSQFLTADISLEDIRKEMDDQRGDC